MSSNETLDSPTTEDNSDSITDAYCVVALVTIAVLGAIYWVTNQ